MDKKELWEKTIEAEQEYNRLNNHCNKCNGNFNDDCIDCPDFNKRVNSRTLFESYKDELKNKYNLNYDKCKELSKVLKKDDLYTDWEESINKRNIFKEDLDKKDEEIKDLKNKYLYLQADVENIKKQYNNKISNITKYEGENIFIDLLEIFDELEFSKCDDIDILNCYNKMTKLLNKYGVYLIYEEDKRPIYFNSEYDEAISSVKTDDIKLDNSINKVYKKGFKFKDKILRFEKVIVNKYE